ncbi:BspA family leucine-rich repeat surface protein, partial [Enterococcus faecalis]|uniref:BspA family leucine-rich repeat surface protein n=1 Tax=Enterococcus faecalis TaxID=1351 RepID=UPI00032FBBFD
MQTKKKKSKKMRIYLHLLMCGPILSTTMLPIITVFAETKTPTPDSSISVPTLATTDIDLTTDTTKTTNSQTSTVSSTDSTTESFLQRSQEILGEETTLDTTQPSSSDEPTQLKQLEGNQEGQNTPQVRREMVQTSEISTGTWGTSSISLDSDGVLTIGSGELSPILSVDLVPGLNVPRSAVKTIVFAGNVKAPKNASYLFYDYTNLTNFIGMENIDTSMVTDMEFLFYNCSSLTSLDLSNFDTSKVVSMISMFNGCKSITFLNLSNFDTSKVTNMSYMFSDCASLSNLNINGFNTSEVTYMTGMFYRCSSLTSLDLSTFRTVQNPSMLFMFFLCKSLSVLKLGNEFRFGKDVRLPQISQDLKWYNLGTGTLKNPSGNKAWTSEELTKYYNPYIDADTYVLMKPKGANVIVRYIDESNNRITDDVVISGYLDNSWQAEEKIFNGYKLVSIIGETYGIFTDKEQSITFIYTKNPVKAQDLTVYYQDINGN